MFTRTQNNPIPRILSIEKSDLKINKALPNTTSTSWPSSFQSITQRIYSRNLERSEKSKGKFIPELPPNEEVSEFVQEIKSKGSKTPLGRLSINPAEESSAYETQPVTSLNGKPGELVQRTLDTSVPSLSEEILPRVGPLAKNLESSEDARGRASSLSSLRGLSLPPPLLPRRNSEFADDEDEYEDVESGEEEATGIFEAGQTGVLTGYEGEVRPENLKKMKRHFGRRFAQKLKSVTSARSGINEPGSDTFVNIGPDADQTVDTELQNANDLTRPNTEES